MADKIQTIGNSILQYGKENDRIYLMKTSKKDYPEIFLSLEKLAKSESLAKIVCKVPKSLKSFFDDNGYEKEASIKKFYNNGEDCLFMSKYCCEKRKINHSEDEINRVKTLCKDVSRVCKKSELRFEFRIKQLTSVELLSATTVYKSVFESYPFPIFDEKYLAKTMKENVNYYGIYLENKLIAVSSSEQDKENLNTELTDFAVLEQYRGQNLAEQLLKRMEKDAETKGFKTLYTIARSVNAGMNITFARNSYIFGGTLINNTNICGNIESMNVWYKNI